MCEIIFSHYILLLEVSDNFITKEKLFDIIPDISHFN